MTERHIIRLPKRTGEVLITEKSDRINVEIRFDKIGEYGDTAELLKWLIPMFERFDSIPKPVVMISPTGPIGTVIGDANSSVAFIPRSA